MNNELRIKEETKMVVDIGEDAIERICRISFARLHDLDAKQERVEKQPAESGEEEERKNAQLDEIRYAKTDTLEIYSIFKYLMDSETFARNNRKKMEAFKELVKRRGGDTDTVSLTEDGYYSFRTEQGQQQFYDGVVDGDYPAYAHAYIPHRENEIVVNGFVFTQVDTSMLR
jgi:hypothetical protein